MADRSVVSSTLASGGSASRVAEARTTCETRSLCAAAPRRPASPGPPTSALLVPPLPVNSGLLGGRQESEAIIGQTPRPSPSSAGQSGFGGGSEDGGSLRSPLRDLGRGLAWAGEGTRKEELGAMTHPSPRFLPTPVQSPSWGREKPLPSARRLAEGAGASRQQSVFGFEQTPPSSSAAGSLGRPSPEARVSVWQPGFCPPREPAEACPGRARIPGV